MSCGIIKEIEHSPHASECRQLVFVFELWSSACSCPPPSAMHQFCPHRRFLCPMVTSPIRVRKCVSELLENAVLGTGMNFRWQKGWRPDRRLQQPQQKEHQKQTEQKSKVQLFITRMCLECLYDVPKCHETEMFCLRFWLVLSLQLCSLEQESLTARFAR